MGFGLAAGWAQDLTDVATENLPDEFRVRFDHPVPRHLPVCGSILDDIWALEETKDPDDSDDIAQAWIAAVEGKWPRKGVEHRW